MSEYQYYEFLAIDEQLDKQAMAALRKISSSARITPNSLMNVYSGGVYGDVPHLHITTPKSTFKSSNSILSRPRDPSRRSRAATEVPQRVVVSDPPLLIQIEQGTLPSQIKDNRLQLSHIFALD